MGQMFSFTKEVETVTLVLGKIVIQGSTALLTVAAGADTNVALGVYVDTNFNAEGKVGDEVTIAFTGLGKVLAGGTIAAGDLISSNASGSGIKVAGAGPKEIAVIGIAKEAAVSGDLFDVAINLHRLHIA